MQTTRRIAFAIVIVTLIGLTGGVWVSGAPDVQERGTQAWTDRLNREAQAAAGRAQTDISLQRASDAYTLRLTEQARAYVEERSRQRAAQAWTDRLNGVAESLNAGE